VGEITAGIGTYGVSLIHRRGNMNSIRIGKYCSIAESVVMDSGFSHNPNYITTYPFKNIKGVGNPSNICKGDIVIGNDVWIGEGAMIMSGVTIGDGAIIAARSVVTKDVDPYTIVGGVPANEIRFRLEKDVVKEMQSIAWWDWPEEKILENADLLTSGNINEFIDKHYGK
jgi:chloramphenicol O-acetyltransferase type B